MPRALTLIWPLTASPLFGQHDGHHNAVNARGDQAMGFSHEKTTHHFLLTDTGGVIPVEANDVADTQSRDQILQHLTHIAMMFTADNFQVPMLLHYQAPPQVYLP